MWIFRLPPWAYMILTPLGLAAAIYLFVDEYQQEASRALARKGEAPATVAIEKFDPARNQGPGQEAVIVGQVDFEQSWELTKTKKGVERGHYVLAPIYPTDAKDNSGQAIGVLMQSGRLSEEQVQAMTLGQGPAGLIMKLDGKVLTTGQVGTNAGEFAEKVKLSPDPVYLDPFEEGRAKGLEADPIGMYVAIGIALASLLLAGFGFWRWKRQQAERAGMI